MIAWKDVQGIIYFGVDAVDIVEQLRFTEWGSLPSPRQWKEEVRKRCQYFGIEIEFSSARSFLDALDFHGVGSWYDQDLQEKQENAKKSA
jgi:hypothetical protein